MSLTNLDLMRKAPSVFSEESKGVTESYKVIPTIEIIEGLRNVGFNPVMACQSRCRIKENISFVKHIIRFRKDRALLIGGCVPEIVLVNSHNGTSSYQMSAGVFRLVCLNGAIVGDKFFERKIRHQGDVIDKVIDSVGEIIEVFPQLIEKVREWEGIRLSEGARLEYAKQAAQLRWDNEEILEQANRLLWPNRSADTSTDLWTTFNVIQEKLIRGGVRYRDGAHFLQRSRKVTSVNENVRLNKELWVLTEKASKWR